MTEQRKRMLADGLVAGLIGYVMVVALFMAVDLITGRAAFHTAVVLGEALFSGVTVPGSVAGQWAPILAFNGVHLLAVLGFGFFAAWLMYEAEQHPQFWYVALFLFLAGAVFGYAGVLALTVVAGVTLSPWLVGSAGMLSAVGVGLWLVSGHRSLVRTIRTSPNAGFLME
jgi:hypothetical protein